MRITAGQPSIAEMLTDWPAQSLNTVNDHQLVDPDVAARLGKEKLALGLHQSAEFAVRKNVEIKSVQVFDLDV